MSVTECKYELPCQDIRLDILRLSGSEPDCDKACIGDLLSGIILDDRVDDETLVGILSKLGFAPEAEELVNNTHNRAWGIVCAHTNLHHYGICLEQKCLSWINFPEVGNCYRVYRDISSREVTVSDIGCVLGLSDSVVDAALQLGKRRVVEELVLNRSDGADVLVLKTASVCAVCESEAGFDVDGWGYCSEECLSEITPDELDLERRFGLPIADVRSILGKKGSQFLGMSVSLPSKSTVQPTYRDERRVSARKTGGWLNQFTVDYYKQNGPPTEQTADWSKDILTRLRSVLPGVKHECIQ